MAVPLPVRPAPLELPLSRPLRLSVQLSGSASRAASYGFGRVEGRTLRYDDLAGFVWWRAGGFNTLNRGGRGKAGTNRDRGRL